MRRPIVAGNWKMHGSRTENARLLEELLAGAPSKPQATCVICPPFVYLQEAARLLRDSALTLGAQDVCADAQGAFTGEVSAADAEGRRLRVRDRRPFRAAAPVPRE